MCQEPPTGNISAGSGPTHARLPHDSAAIATIVRRRGGFSALFIGSRLQQLERVRPFAAEKSGNAPEDAERLDRARRFDGAHVGRLPSELSENPFHDLLGDV